MRAAGNIGAAPPDVIASTAEELFGAGTSTYRAGLEGIKTEHDDGRNNVDGRDRFQLDLSNLRVPRGHFKAQSRCHVVLPWLCRLLLGFCIVVELWHESMLGVVLWAAQVFGHLVERIPRHMNYASQGGNDVCVKDPRQHQEEEPVGDVQSAHDGQEQIAHFAGKVAAGE